jgi:hypothetical protein
MAEDTQAQQAKQFPGPSTEISGGLENEVAGLKLLIIHTAICFCTFLVGLVSAHVHTAARISNRL